MRVSDKAIVLRAVKHGDKKLILKLYTKQHGILTVGVTVGTSPKARLRKSTVLPLNLIDAEFIIKQNKDIHQLTEATCYRIHSNLNSSIAKLSIAQFLNDILIKTLKEHHGNVALFEFIENCLDYLNDSEENYNNLHLYFLIELTKYLGFEPQNNFSEKYPFFDCREGQFTSFSLASPLGLNKTDSQLLSGILKVNSLEAKLNHVQRQTLLEILLVYYQFHIPNFTTLKSMQVLTEIFKS